MTVAPTHVSGPLSTLDNRTSPNTRRQTLHGFVLTFRYRHLAGCSVCACKKKNRGFRASNLAPCTTAKQKRCCSPGHYLTSLAEPMAAMAEAGLEGSTLFCLTDDTREMVDEVSERFATRINNFTDRRRRTRTKEQKRAAVAWPLWVARPYRRRRCRTK